VSPDAEALSDHQLKAAALLDGLIIRCRHCETVADGRLAAVLTEISEQGREVQAEVVRQGFARIQALRLDVATRENSNPWTLINFHWLADWSLGVSDLMARLLRRKLPLSEADFAEMVRVCADYGVVSTRVMPHVAGLCCSAGCRAAGYVVQARG